MYLIDTDIESVIIYIEAVMLIILFAWIWDAHQLRRQIWDLTTEISNRVIDQHRLR